MGVLPGVMPVYIDGRIICAAAGNMRNDNSHWQATIPAGGEVSVVYQPVLSGGTYNADGITFWAYNEEGTSVRLRISTRHSSNAVLATAEVPLWTTNGAVPTNLPGGLRVSIHNGPPSPSNRHYNPEIYWTRSSGSPALPAGPWIIRLRNTAASACVVHGFCAFREFAGSFVFAAAQTQPLIGVTYTAAQLAQFNSHKVSTPGNAPGCICVAAYTSEPGMAGQPVDEIAWFSSPGPLRAAGPGRRAIDVALPGNRIVSARSSDLDPSRGVIAMAGTSMATPIMTGLVAAKLQINRNLDTGDLRNEIEVASTRRPTDTVDDWGLGRVDATRFLRV
jgi:subtilisin family serine protease